MDFLLTRRGLGFSTAGAALLAASGARANDPAYVWKNVKVGAGGFIPGVVFSSIERGLAYARSDMGGAYRFDAGVDRWIPLNDASPISGDFGIESIAPDPVDPNVVYAAVGVSRRDPGAILRSEDRGTTWRRTFSPAMVATG